MTENKFSFKIHNHIAVLSRNGATSWTREINRVSFNSGRVKYDIRDWNPEHTQMGRGISLNDSEMDVLRGLFEHGRL